MNKYLIKIKVGPYTRTTIVEANSQKDATHMAKEWAKSLYDSLSTTEGFFSREDARVELIHSDEPEVTEETIDYYYAKMRASYISYSATPIVN